MGKLSTEEKDILESVDSGDWRSIRDKEKEAWPEGGAGYEESRQYREALAAAVAQVLVQERSDRYRRLNGIR